MAQKNPASFFFKPQTILLPTRIGWVICLMILAGAAVIFIKTIHPFLSETHPVRGDILVVEGWAPDYVLLRAKNEFQSHPYHLLITTGGPLDVGTFLSEYRS